MDLAKRVAGRVSEKLARAVFRQLGETGEELLSSLRDVARHGANTGWSGFTYYTDTVAFFKRNRKEIVALVESMASDLGEEPIKMVAGFNCLRDDDTAYASAARALYGGRIRDDDIQVANALAWFALEEVARAVEDMEEEEPEPVKEMKTRYSVTAPHGLCEKAGRCVEHDLDPEVEPCR